MHTNYFVSNSPYGAMVWIVVERPPSKNNKDLLPAQDGTALWVMSLYYTTIEGAERSAADSMDLEGEVAELEDTAKVIRLYAKDGV